MQKLNFFMICLAALSAQYPINFDIPSKETHTNQLSHYQNEENSLKNADSFLERISLDNTSSGAVFTISLFAFCYGDIANLDNTNDPAYSIKVLKNMPYVITTNPSKQSYKEELVTDAIKANTKLFGYVNMGPDNPNDDYTHWKHFDINKVKMQIDAITNSGWFGVFIDQFGYDYGNTRAEQNEIVDYAHSKGLKCIANAWSPEDVMGSEINKTSNPNGILPHIKSGDFYLIESFLTSNSGYRGDSSYMEKYLKAKDYQDRLGVNIIAVSYPKELKPALDDTRMSYILAQSLGYKGWWLADTGYINSSNDFKQNMDIGTFTQFLKHVAGDKYVAQTTKYTIEYFADDTPYMKLISSIDGTVIVIGEQPPNDAININNLTHEEALAFQQRLNDYGFRDSDGNILDEDGVFGHKSISALKNFLKANKFSYFNFIAKSALFGNYAINSHGTTGPLKKDI